MRRHFALSVFIILMAVLTVMPAVAAPVGLDPGVVLQSKAAKEQAKRDAEAKKDALNRCKHGWASLARAESPQTAFTSRDACLDYVKAGGSVVTLVPTITIGFRVQDANCWVDVNLMNLQPGQTYTVQHFLNGTQNEINEELRQHTIVAEPDGTALFTPFFTQPGYVYEGRLFDAGGTYLTSVSETTACS